MHELFLTPPPTKCVPPPQLAHEFMHTHIHIYADSCAYLIILYTLTCTYPIIEYIDD